ncbi:hypothetical protein HY993_02820 [Candidatus Micrarchaeota archaeon]|nr:hypothetical protein [Candidatus Micrarchaeota archaeon]
MVLVEQMADSEFSRIASEFREFNEKMKDPLVVGALLNKVASERTSANLMLKQIMEKLDSIDERVSKLESQKQFSANNRITAPQGNNETVLLSQPDEAIMELVEKHGATDAQAVKEKLGYKGKNAASSRMNALYKMNLLDKKQVGRKVFFVKKSR